MGVKRLIIFLFLFSECYISFGQVSTDRISVDGLNSKYLEHLIKTKVDSVRTGLGLNPLVNDSILYVAAKYHGDWLNENRAFSHYENDNEEYKTPQNRAEQFGAINYLVGENIIKSYINKSLKTKKTKKTYINRTYQDLANDFVVGWVNSPGHFANIISADYKLTGLAISIDENRKLIYCVQKFADILFEYDFVENKKMFRYSNYQAPKKITSFNEVEYKPRPRKYDWNVKEAKDSLKLCSSCNISINNRAYKDHIKFKNLSLNYKSFNINVIEEILKYRKSGLMVEEVEYTPYDCGNSEYYTKPSRRNNLSKINGKIYRPKYRKDLKKGLIGSKEKGLFNVRIKNSALYFKKNLARLTKESMGFLEYNIIVLQKNKICRVMHYSDFCGEQFYPIFTPKLKEYLKVFEYDMSVIQDTFNFDIQFEKNKYEYSSSEIFPLLKALKDTRYIIKELEIDAFSSLEGSQEINEKLQHKRAESILQVIRSFQEDSIISTVKTSENWELFHTQIDSFDVLQMFKDLSEDEIKRKLSESVILDSIEPFLAKQRIGKVSLKVEYKPTPDLMAKEIFDELRGYFRENKYVEYKSIAFSKADSIYTLLFSLYKLESQENSSTNYLMKLEKLIDPVSNYYEYLIDINVAMQNYDNRLLSETYYNDINKLYYPSFHTAYNKLNLSLNELYKNESDRKLNPDSILGTFHYIKRFFPNEYNLSLDSLELNYLFQVLNFIGKEIKSKNDQKMINKFCDLLMLKAESMDLSEEFLFTVAKHLLEFENDVNAYRILESLIKTKTKIEEVYVLHAKMAYYHNQEYNNHSYHDYLINLYGEISQKSWCEMFVGSCNISFQVFDYEKLRNFYCEKCEAYKNYAQQPELWKK